MKAVRPRVVDILTHWKDWLLDHSFDLGWPTCWACRNGWNGKYDVFGWTTLEEAAKAWEKAPLIRCHIVPESLGGPTNPSNMFLLCQDCHDRAPDTSSVDAFMKWAESQDYNKSWKEEFMREWTAFGLAESDLVEFGKLVTLDEEKRAFTFAEDFERYLENNTTQWPFTGS